MDTQYNLTWSKCFDLNSVNRGGQGDYPQINNDNPVGSTALAHANFQDNRGLCDHDVRLNFNVSGVYDFPDIHALGEPPGNGWQLSTIYTAISGRPFSVFKNGGGDPSGQGLTGSGIRADVCSGYSDRLQHRESGRTTSAQAFPISFYGPCGRDGRQLPPQYPDRARLEPVGHDVDQEHQDQRQAERRNSLGGLQRLEPCELLHCFSLDNTVEAARSSARLTETPDVAAGNPVIAQGGPRNMNFSFKFTFWMEDSGLVSERAVH